MWGVWFFFCYLVFSETLYCTPSMLHHSEILMESCLELFIKLPSPIPVCRDWDVAMQVEANLYLVIT